MNKVQNYLIRELRQRKILCGKLEGLTGWPDVIICLPNNRILFVEIKTGQDRLRPAQTLIHEKLRNIGTDVKIVRTISDADDIIRRCEVEYDKHIS